MKTATDPILQRFLQRQLEEGLALCAASDLVRLQPVAGLPPFQYFARFACKGLARTRSGQVLEHDLWQIAIQFPPDYLRSQIHPSQLLAFLGMGERLDLLPWHPNIRDCFVCLEVTPGMTLVEIVYGLFDLLTWRLYSTRDEGLNHAAAQWARNQPPERFPVDRRPLKRRTSGAFTVEELAVHP
jgi:hypothetical protein